MAPREWLHVTSDDYEELKAQIDRFNSFPTEVCEMEWGDGRTDCPAQPRDWVPRWSPSRPFS